VRRASTTLFALGGIAFAVIIVMADSRAFARSYPYETMVARGDIRAARIIYGDRASAGLRDALPAFADIDAYRFYSTFASYYSINDDDCGDSCVAAAYRALASAGRIRLLTVGTPVTVLSESPNSEDGDYTICHVRLAGSAKSWIVLSGGLADAD